jgi:hypothetical protein
VKGRLLFVNKKKQKNFVNAGPWALSPTQPMPSGAIPTVLRTAGTFSPSARHKRSFCAAFFKKRLFP